MIARNVIEEAESASTRLSERDECYRLVELRKQEVTFYTRLCNTLELIQQITDQLAIGQDAAVHGRLVLGIEQYETCLRALVELQPYEETVLVELLQQRIQKLRTVLEERVASQWDALLSVDAAHRSLMIRTKLPVDGAHGVSTELKTIVDLASRLSLLDSKLAKLCRDIERWCLDPCLTLPGNGQMEKLQIVDDTVTIVENLQTQSSLGLLADLTGLVDYLHQKLPSAIRISLSESLMPLVVSRIVSDWLSSSIPTTITNLEDFEVLVERVNAFAEHLATVGWHGGADLNDWVEQGPKVWLGKRRESSLALVRDVLSERIEQTKSVERVETQMLDRKDVIATTNGMGDDWDAGWGHDEEQAGNNNEEDTSAWEVEQESSTQDTVSSAVGQGASDHDDGMDNVDDAWGWGDQDAPTSTGAHGDLTQTRSPAPHVNGKQERTQQEATLKESYTVTAVPDEILHAIIELTEDAGKLQRPEYAKYRVASAASALYSVPTLVLAGYRALAQSYYTTLQGGNMFLYNDTVRLATELETFSSGLEHSEPDAFRRIKITDDIEALSSFGKRAYGKEMESQRTILRDLLDGAQGFANCTEEPFSAECENAIAMTMDRLRLLGKEWEPILSQSAWLQSLGSLLSTIIGKIIMDICDLSDISEPESGKLRQLCNEVEKISVLFALKEDAERSEHEARPERTAIFTPNWIKFQYLGEILDSSLADIKYLWSEGALKLDFEPGEIIDLIEALFVDSPRRKEAITEIRRG